MNYKRQIKMETNKAILNAFTKQLQLCFKNKKFKLDLNEGDLHDYWNTITTDDGVEYDVNFVWDLKPTVIVYRCGDYEQQYNNEIIVFAHEVIGTKATFFETEFLNIGSSVFVVYTKYGKIKKVFKSLNKASDIMKKSDYMIVLDCNGATKTYF